jgi:chromosome segregation ATPase
MLKNCARKRKEVEREMSSLRHEVSNLLTERTRLEEKVEDLLSERDAIQLKVEAMLDAMTIIEPDVAEAVHR